MASTPATRTALEPLRALRYNPEFVELGEVVAPPYDVISPADRDAYIKRSSHSIVRLLLPDAPSQAARLLQEWRREGAFLRDTQPSIWWHTQTYVAPDGDEGERSGFLSAIRLAAYDEGRIRRHERTHSATREGRLELMRAVRTNLSPVFGLYDDPDGAPRAALAPHVSGPPAMETTDADGTVHRFWQVTDPAAIAAVQEAMAERTIVIADGHHRYETALAYHEELGTPASGYMMVVLVSLEDPGLTIFPTHRVFREPPPELLAGEKREDPESALNELEGLERGRAAVVVYDGSTELAVDGAGELDVQLVDRLGQEGLSYTADWREAVRAVDAGDAAVAVLMRPTRIEDVFEVAARGETMPQKSTYFYPKLVSGLLFHPLGA
jgi:uncharacterized protein (DUF1015 family)